MPPALTLTPLPAFPLIRPGDDLASIILTSCQRANLALQAGDIFVLAQKIISKAEGRLVHLRDVHPSPEALRLAQQSQKDPRLCELILRESQEVMRVRPGLIIVRHRLGFVCANAGIDRSNVDAGDDACLLLPADPTASAARLRAQLESACQCRLGVLIIDSHGRAWRQGVVGTTIGLSGLPALVDERGWQDLFGEPLRVTTVGVADELAAAASLMMGQAAEGRPVIHVRGFPYPLAEGHLNDLLRPKAKDLFL